MNEERKRRGLTHNKFLMAVAISSLLISSGNVMATQTTSGSISETTEQLQSMTVKGLVVDATGEPIIGASIVENGTTNGGITDLDGKFTLNVKPGATLKISYVGYQTLEVKAAKTMRVVLKEDSEMLSEVVVVGYGSQKKTNLTGAVSTVDVNKTLDSRPIADVGRGLQGSTPGLTITIPSSEVGTDPNIKIRGAVASLEGNSKPLILMDNVEIPSISLVNPDDIESISILKDAAASSIYGSKAAFGVILITTKKGAIGKPRISYSNSTSFSRPFVTPEFQNTYGRKEGEFKSWGDKLDKPSTYNPLDFFQTGFNTMNSIAVSTGTETNQTHISFGAVNSEGIIDNNKYNRYNFTFRNSWDIVKNVLSMDMGLFYIKQNNQNSNGQGMYYNPLVPIYLFPPSDDINKYAVYERYDADRNFKTQYWPYGNQGLGMQNPYWIINRNMFNTDRDRYIMSLSMKWNITNWLNIIGRARIDNAYTDFERKLYASTDGLFSKSQGNYMNQEDKNTSTYLDFLVNVDKKFGENYHLLVNLGGSFYDEKYKSDTFEGNLVGVPNFFHPSNIPSTESNYNKSELHTQTQSIYGKAEIGYRNFLYADVTGRIDWFSTLVGTSKEYVCYPSAGLSVILSEILPLPEKIISFWKIRGSYAQVGNPPSAYLPYATVALENGNATSANFTPASHLKPEMTKAFEFGMDLRLFQNKLNIAATYYNSNTYNQLFKYELPPSTGYAFAYENAGKVNNWGIELSVGFNQDLGPVQWNSNLIYSMNRNEIKELLPEYVTDRTTGMTVKSPTEFSVATADSYRMILKEGGSMSDIYATKLKQDLHGNILITNGGVSAEENTFIKVGSAAPKYNLGFRNSFSWKGLELDFLIDARVGGEVISATQALMDQFGVSQQTADARDNKGVVVNKGKLDAEQYYGTVASGKTGLLAHYVYSATNVRLREMSLSYMLPSKWFGEKLNISLSLTGHNLLMFYNKAPFDPELTANTGTYYQGFDYFMPPSLRSFGFGVKVNF